MLLHKIRHLMVADDRKLAVDAATADALARATRAPHRRLLSALSAGRVDRPSVLVGRVADTGEDVRVPVDELVGVSRWTTGSTGSGKSAQVLAETLALLVPQAPWSLIAVDGKSESAPWLVETFLPATLAQWREKHVVQFFDQFRVVNPFDPNNLPELNVLAGGADAEAIRAKEIAALVTESLGADGGAFGHRMMTILLFAIRLAISLGGLSLLEVRSMLGNAAYLDGLLRFVRDPELKEYFVFRFPRESKESVAAVISRLDLLLLLPDTCRSLGAKQYSLDFAPVLERGVTICDVGSPPRGAEYLSGFWQGVLFRGLARSIMGRPVERESPPVFCVMDEWWTGIDREIALHFERLLTLARFKKAAMWLLNQLPGQIGSRFPQLLATLKNSCGIQIAFRQSHEDASSMAYMLPPGSEASVGPRGRSPTEEQARRHLVAELARLPDRTFWFFYKRRGLEAVKLVSPTVDFDGARRAADAAPIAIRDACQRSTVAASRAHLDEIIAQRRAHMQAVASGVADAPAPEFDRKPVEIRDRRGAERRRREVAPAQPPPAVKVHASESMTGDESREDGEFPFLG